MTLTQRITRWVSVGYPDLPEPTIVHDGTEVYETYDDLGDDWLHLGVCPRPVTWWQKFRYHVGMGLVMQYPVWKVIVWSLVNTDGSFRDEDDPRAGWTEAIEGDTTP